MKSALAISVVLILGVNLASAQESVEPLAPGEKLFDLRLPPALEVVSSMDKGKGLIWIQGVTYSYVPVMKEVLVTTKDGAKQTAMKMEHGYENEQGDPVEWKLRGILEVQDLCEETLEQGVEVFRTCS